MSGHWQKRQGLSLSDKKHHDNLSVNDSIFNKSKSELVSSLNVIRFKQNTFFNLHPTLRFFVQEADASIIKLAVPTCKVVEIRFFQ